MPITVYDPYYPGPIVPICKIGQNLGVYSQKAYRFYRALHIEGIPESRQMTQDLGAVTSGSTGSATEITITNMPEGTLGHFRLSVMDDFEAEVTQVRGTGRFITNSAFSRLSLFSGAHNPHLTPSTIFIIGATRQIYITPINAIGFDLAKTRIRAWGYKYVIDQLTESQERALQFLVLNKVSQLEPELQELLKRGLTATIVPAEGRES